MPRLIIDAVSGSGLYQDGLITNVTVEVLVAVSYADTGDGVTKLKQENFRISNLSSGNDALDAVSIEVKEKTWDTDDTFASGFYALKVTFPGLILSAKFTQEYSFGLAVTGPFTLDKSKILNGRTVVIFKAVKVTQK